MERHFPTLHQAMRAYRKEAAQEMSKTENHTEPEAGDV
jgi:hypothetical protein